MTPAHDIKENMHFPQFLNFLGPLKNVPEMAPIASILGRTDLYSENFHVGDFLGLQIFGFPDSWIPRFPSCQPKIAGAFSPAAPRWLRGGSLALPDHKVQDIQGTRTIP